MIGAVVEIIDVESWDVEPEVLVVLDNDPIETDDRMTTLASITAAIRLVARMIDLFKHGTCFPSEGVGSQNNRNVTKTDS